MTECRWHEIWMEQCEAAEAIKVRYGVESAYDYVVGEKLLNFAEAAAEHPEFAQALPQFVSRVRGMFTPEEMKAHLARTERHGIAQGEHQPVGRGVQDEAELVGERALA